MRKKISPMFLTPIFVYPTVGCLFLLLADTKAQLTWINLNSFSQQKYNKRFAYMYFFLSFHNYYYTGWHNWIPFQCWNCIHSVENGPISILTHTRDVGGGESLKECWINKIDQVPFSFLEESHFFFAFTKNCERRRPKKLITTFKGNHFRAKLCEKKLACAKKNFLKAVGKNVA